MNGEWTALPAGLVIATLATLAGFGGGILWMPFLLLVAHLDPSKAVVTSLVIQTVGMGSGAAAVVRAKKVDFRMALYLSLSSFPGVSIGVFLSGMVSKDFMVFALGCLSLTMSLVFVYTQDQPDTRARGSVTFRETGPYLCVSGLFAVLTGLLSMGVGDFLVPILRNRLRLSMERAMSACLVVMATGAAFAAALHLAVGEQFSLFWALWAIPGVLVGGQLGPRLAGRFPDETLKEIFVYGLSLAGIHMMFNLPGGG